MLWSNHDKYHFVLLAAWMEAEGMVGGWGAAANKNNHLKRHAIVQRHCSNFPFMFRDCLVLGCVKRERALYPDKNGNNPYEFVVKNREVGGETRQKRGIVGLSHTIWDVGRSERAG